MLYEIYETKKEQVLRKRTLLLHPNRENDGRMRGFVKIYLEFIAEFRQNPFSIPRFRAKKPH